jgi:hypothetical protein
MASSFPGGLDNFTNPTATDTLDSATVPHAAQHGNANDAIEAIESTLGVNPQGSSATVVARLTALDSTVADKVASVSAGDSTITVAGTATAPTVKVGTITSSQISDKGAASGVASLNSSGKVTAAQLDAKFQFNVMDYGAIGDGTTNDYAAFTSCLAAMTSGGVTSGQLLLPANKTFRLSSSVIISNAQNFSITGYGATLAGVTDANRVLGITSGSNVSIKGLTITNTGATSRVASGYGISLGSISRLTVTDCTVYNVASSGIICSNITNALISGNVVRDNFADGIDVWHASSNVDVVGNNLYNTGDDGIAVVSQTGLASNITITGNAVVSGAARGIAVDGGTKVSITGNNIDASSGSGILVNSGGTYATLEASHIVVANNLIKNANTGYPTIVSASLLANVGTGGVMSNITFTGNTIINGSSSYIVAKGISTSLIDNINIISNTCTGANVSSVGISIDYVTLVSCVSNVVNNAYNSGIYVNTTVAKAKILFNDVNSPNVANAGSQYGIYNGATASQTAFNGITITNAVLSAQTATSGAGSNFVSSQNIVGNQIQSVAATRGYLATGTAAFYVARSDAGFGITQNVNAGAGVIDTQLTRDSAGTFATTQGLRLGTGSRIFSGSGAPTTTTTVSGSQSAIGTAVTLASSNTAIKVGMAVTGTNVPASTVVTAISGTSLTLSNASTSIINTSLSFNYIGVVGDLFIRTDTATTALQRLYMCSTAGTPGTWTALI